MLRTACFLIACAMAVFSVQPASAVPITYEVHRTMSELAVRPGCDVLPEVGPCFVTYTLSGTVTTDGTLGLWTEDHVLATSMTISDGTGQSVALPDHFLLFITATETQLSVPRLSFPNGARFFAGTTGSGWNSCGVFRTGCSEVMAFPNGPVLVRGFGDAGVDDVVFAVVPEPTSPILLALGIGGLASRRGRSSRRSSRREALLSNRAG